ncbi:MAG: truB [Candidatus Paceibacter sp.]|jgi:tRNA pseudouridine55 synthase|nr:truB [Candidatus Paceibacter sp.]
MEKQSNILLIDKPKGISSYDCIRILQRKFGKIKMGHAGTLDPLATGLMIIGINEGTKQLHALLGLPKTYEAEILLGIRTETGDVEGKVVEEKVAPELDEKYIKDVLATMIGTLEITVPIYSAIKRQGKRLYEYAREGKEVEVPVKPMLVIEATLLEQKANVLTVKWNVGSGTYIRSLAEELGKRLGTVATVQNLRRTSIGDYDVADAMKI